MCVMKSVTDAWANNPENMARYASNGSSPADVTAMGHRLRDVGYGTGGSATDMSALAKIGTGSSGAASSSPAMKTAARGNRTVLAGGSPVGASAGTKTLLGQ